MSAEGIVLIIAAVSTAITSIIAAWQARAARAEVESVKKATDGIVDRLVATTAREAHAEGVAQGESQVSRPPSPNDPRDRFRP